MVDVDVVKSGISPDKGVGDNVDNGRLPLPDDPVGEGGLSRAGRKGKTMSRSPSVATVHRSRLADAGKPSVANSRRVPACTDDVAMDP